MDKTSLIFGFLLLLASCGASTENPDGRPSQEVLKADIQAMDDSLKVYYTAVMKGEAENVPASSITKAIDLHILYYNYYPKDEYSAECLDKVHQLYMQEKSYVKSVRTCDTLIAKFPSYKNRNEVLLSAASTYDYLLRDTVNAKKYYELLLKSPKTGKETRESVKFRLKHIHLTFDEMVEMQMKNTGSK